MDEQLRRLVTGQHGVLAGGQLPGLGISERRLRAAVAEGSLVQVRRGAYVSRDAALTPEQSYARRARAILHSRPPGEALSHHCALAVRDLPLVGLDLRRVDLMGAVPRTTLRGVARVRPLGDRSVVLVGNARCVEAAVALVQVALASGVTPAVVAADQALRLGLCTEMQLTLAAEAERPVRARRRLERFLASVEPLSESAGESRTRLILSGSGLRVCSQRNLFDDTGGFVGRADLVVEGLVVVEFDGAGKYRQDDGSGRVLIAEKQREDRIRALGYPVVRVTWADLNDPARLVARVRAALDTARRWRAAAQPHDVA